jgi:hypothetical protein
MPPKRKAQLAAARLTAVNASLAVRRAASIANAALKAKVEAERIDLSLEQPAASESVAPSLLSASLPPPERRQVLETPSRYIFENDPDFANDLDDSEVLGQKNEFDSA